MQKSMKTLPIEQIKPYENNPRINDDAVEAVRKSMEQCGYIAPIVVDENHVVLAGHTRLKALKEMGAKECDVLEVAGLSEEQKRKYRLLDNKTNELALWDFDALAEELEGLDFDDLELDWGVDLDGDLVFDEPPEEDDFDEDDADEHGVQLGQVWKLGGHRLMCGDSTSRENVDNLIADGHIDMIFTDPPYGMTYQSNRRKETERFNVLTNDDKFLDFLPIVKGCLDGFIFVCTTWKVLDKWLPMFESSFDLTNMIIWNKGGGGIGDLEHTFSTDYEVILCANNGHKILGKRIGSVWNVGKDKAVDYEHPTPKPVELAATAITHTTNKGAAVLDLFGGSGSTLIACEQLERNCYMMELDPHYCDVIISRWENYTGEKAELIAG